MKALSLHQPWATLVAHGHKRIETRSWATQFRGTLVLHAGLAFPDPAKQLCRLEPFQTCLRDSGFPSWDQLPLGVLLGTADLVDCERIEEAPIDDAREAAFGDYRPGRWVWTYANAVAFPSPIPFKGKLGLFDVPATLVEVPAHA